MDIHDINKYKSDKTESNTLFGQSTLGVQVVRQTGTGNSQLANSQLLYVTTSATSESGRTVDMSTLARNSTVLSCVALKARALAQLPIKIKWETEKGEMLDALSGEGVPDRDKAKARSVAKLLNSPNKFQSRYEFFYQWVMWYELAGESFTLLFRDDRTSKAKTPLEMYVMDSTLITAQISATRYPQYRLSTPAYGYSKDEPLAAHEIIHAKEMPWQGSGGFNKGIMATTLVGIDTDLDLYASFVLQNGAKPSGLFVTEQVIPDGKFKEIAARMKEAWSSMIGSRSVDPSKPGQSMLLDNGMKYVPLDMLTMQDTDAKALKEQVMIRIATLFGVPHQLLGIGDAKFNNMQAMLDEFYKSTMLPMTENLEQKFGSILFDGHPSLSMEFDIADFLKGDPLNQMNYVVAGVKNGILTPNEARQYLGKTRIDDPEADKLQEPQAGGFGDSGDAIDKKSPQHTGGGGNTSSVGKTGRAGSV